MSICTSCNAHNPDENRFCQNCGQPLPSASVLGEAAQSPVSVSPPPVFAYSAPPTSAAPVARKDKSIALILEILPGLFGFLGIGWIYIGQTSTGLIWLIGYLVWVVVATILNVVTGGIACFCTLPIGIAALAASAYFLNENMKKHPELFG